MIPCLLTLFGVMFTLSLTALTVVVFRQQVVRLLAERPRLISGRSKSIEAVAGFVLVAIAIRKSCFVEGTGYHVRNVLVSALLIALAVPDEDLAYWASRSPRSPGSKGSLPTWHAAPIICQLRVHHIADANLLRLDVARALIYTGFFPGPSA